MFCPNCGQRQVSNEARFCPACGFPLEVVGELVASGGRLHWRPPEFPGVDPSRSGLQRQRRRRLFAPRALLPVVADPDDDEVGIQPLQRRAIESPIEPLGRAGRQVFHERVGSRDQFVKLRQTGLRTEID